MTFLLCWKLLAGAQRESLGDLFDATKQSLGFKNVLKEVLLQSDKIGSAFTSTKDLQNAMVKDSKLFKEVQEKILDIGDKSFKRLEEEIKERSALIKDEKERKEFLKKEEEKILELQQRSTNNLQDNLNNLVSQDKSLKKIKTSFNNIKDLVDELGSKLRDPSIAVEGLLTDLGKIPMYLQKAQKEGKSFGVIMKDVGKLMAGGIADAAALLFTPTGLLILGIGAAVAAMAGLFKLFTNYWDFMDKKIMPAQAEFNRQVGGSGKAVSGLKSQMNSAGVELELLGYSFEEGAGMVRDFAKAANTGITIPKDVLKTGKELTFVLGLTAEQSGKLVQQFQKQGAGMNELNEMFKIGSKEARAYGLPVNDVLRDIGDAPDILARFGVANRKEFAVSAAKARSYGLSIKDLTSAFGKQLDTFEGSSMAASKLNAIFGTNINSLKLMMEHDPTKRMEMLRSSLLRQGKSWEKLSVSERNVITQTLGVDEATAQLALSSDSVRKSLEAQAIKKKQAIRDDEKWNDGMRSIQKVLIPWGPLLDQLSRKAFDFVAQLLGFKGASDPVLQTAKGARSALDSIGSAIDKAITQIDRYRESWYDATEWIDSSRANKAVAILQKQTKSVEDLADLQDYFKNEDVKNITAIKLRARGLVKEGSSADSMISEVQNADTSKAERGFFSGIGRKLKAFSDAEEAKYKEMAGDTTPPIQPPAEMKPIEAKPVEIIELKKKIKDQEKENKTKENKKKEEKEKHKDLAEAIGASVAKQLANGSDTINVILTNLNGTVLANGIVKDLRRG